MRARTVDICGWLVYKHQLASGSGSLIFLILFTSGGVSFDLFIMNGHSDTDSYEDGFFSYLTQAFVNRLRRGEYRTPDSSEDEGDLLPLTPTFSPRLELFVGNLPFNVNQDDLLQCLNTSPFAAAPSININQIIKPVRGRPFAFVRCACRETYQEIVAGNYVSCVLSNVSQVFEMFLLQTLGGRVLRIARSTRIHAELMPQDDEEDDEFEAASSSLSDPAPDAYAAPTNPDSAMVVLRKESQDQLSALEAEFQAKFEATEAKLTEIREKRAEREREKRGLQERMSDMKAQVALCEAQMRILEAEEKSKEQDFSSFIDEHNAKVEVVRERINRLRQLQQGDTKTALPAEIRDDLDCICCYEVMGENGSKIFQCPEGHLICPKCHHRLQKCPMCRALYTKPGIRNRMAESLASFVCKASE